MSSVTDAAPDVRQITTLFVNVFVLSGADGWVLVDAGIPGYAERIRSAAAEFIGSGEPPRCIVLTHGHIDHVGSLAALLEMWDVPVYAHPLEFPYLTGRRAYPPPDPLVGGGMMAWSSRLLPRGPFDIGPRLLSLPPAGQLPTLPSWRIVPTPGHTPGHVSLFRDGDRTLIAGDAVTTVKQESVLAIATQRRQMHGPPAYFTTDWDAARESARTLALLEPEILASGHGQPMRGAGMRAALHELAADFDRVARPRFGRYASDAPVVESDRVLLPPDPLPKVLAAAAGVSLLAGAGWWITKQRSSIDRTSVRRHPW